MRDFMINMMAAMMPFMKPLMWLGVAAAAVGLLFLIMHIIFRSSTGGWVLLMGRVTLGFAAFFFACQVAGYFLGAAPGINFGDFSKMEFNIVPFWQIGAGFLVAALVLGFFGGRTRVA
ncbi:MAG: hypothetical protein KDJ18_12970 [Hyphomicrobiaceae bacterium]|nr:hypothetical protein [Hyphomicrobiaceae bacterium]